MEAATITGTHGETGTILAGQLDSEPCCNVKLGLAVSPSIHSSSSSWRQQSIVQGHHLTFTFSSTCQWISYQEATLQTQVTTSLTLVCLYVSHKLIQYPPATSLIPNILADLCAYRDGHQRDKRSCLGTTDRLTQVAFSHLSPDMSLDVGLFGGVLPVMPTRLLSEEFDDLATENISYPPHE